MTTVVILLLGFSAVLFSSAIATDPTTGNDLSIVQTVIAIWNNDISFSQTANSSATNQSTVPPFNTRNIPPGTK